MEKRENTDRETPHGIYTVRLEGMSFKAFHGCLDEEKLSGNDFSVDFLGSYATCAGETDALEDTIDYGKVYDCVAAVMNGERCNLLETLCRRISDRIMKEMPGFGNIEVTVSKKNPPVAGDCEWSRVTYKSDRDE